MSKVKVNSGLLALMILATLFVGWQAMLLVTVLIFAFFEIDEKVKNVTITVVTFYLGLAVVTSGWNLIVDGIELVFSSISNIVAIINSYLDYSNMINIEKLQSYVITPASNIIKIADGVVSFLLLFVKLGFIIAVLTGKKQKDNFITNKVNSFVSKALSFINNFNVPAQNTMQENYQNVTQPNDSGMNTMSNSQNYSDQNL